MQNEVRYFDEINILRACAILAVISIHVSTYFTIMSTINLLTAIYLATWFFSNFAVPLFVCISGFVLYNKYPYTFNIINFYKKRLKSVLPQYLIFSTLGLGVIYISSVLLSKPVDFGSVLNIISLYATGVCFYHLWFFVLIIQLYIFYPAIARTYNYCNSYGRSIELLFIVFLMGVFYNAYSIQNIFTSSIAMIMIGRATVITGYIFYFILGMAVQSRYDKLNLKTMSNISLYSLSIPLFFGTLLGFISFAQIFFVTSIGGQYLYWLVSVVTPLYYIIIFIICLRISIHLASSRGITFKMLEIIGRNSFGIYLVHALILYMMILVLSLFGFDWNNWLFYPLMFCLTLILSLVSVHIIHKFPYSEYIIGRITKI
jgi:probable poly-beta-1,6-N-acetyl-D-glucosamine export protein